MTRALPALELANFSGWLANPNPNPSSNPSPHPHLTKANPNPNQRCRAQSRRLHCGRGGRGRRHARRAYPARHTSVPAHATRRRWHRALRRRPRRSRRPSRRRRARGLEPTLPWASARRAGLVYARLAGFGLVQSVGACGRHVTGKSGPVRGGCGCVASWVWAWAWGRRCRWGTAGLCMCDKPEWCKQRDPTPLNVDSTLAFALWRTMRRDTN